MFGLKRKALKYANEIRHDLKLQPLADLPTGKRGDKHGCVIQRAISADSKYNAHVGKFQTTIGIGTHYTHPFRVRLFIALFDLGFFSKYSSYSQGKSKLVYASDVMTKKEKKEQKKQLEKVNLEMELENLQKSFEVLQRSFEQTAQDLRSRIRKLEEKERQKDEENILAALQ